MSKVDFQYIQYILAAKIDFTIKSILGASDPPIVNYLTLVFCETSMAGHWHQLLDRVEGTQATLWNEENR